MAKFTFNMPDIGEGIAEADGRGGRSEHYTLGLAGPRSKIEEAARQGRELNKANPSESRFVPE